MYVNLETKQIFTRRDMKRTCPNVSFPKNVAAVGFAELYGDDIPEVNPGQHAEATSTAIEKDGKWFRVYEIKDDLC